MAELAKRLSIASVCDPDEDVQDVRPLTTASKAFYDSSSTDSGNDEVGGCLFPLEGKVKVSNSEHRFV